MHHQITSYATLVYTFLTLLILFVNIYYITKFRQSVVIQYRSSQGQLLYEMIRDFFYREPHKKIIIGLEEEIPLRSNIGILDTELDDHIGFFETLGTFVRAQILDSNLVWAVFSHYVESAYESPEIADYVKGLQGEDPTMFEDFVWLYKEMKSESHSRQRAKLRQP